MKHLIVFAFIAISSITLAQDKSSNLNWLTNLEEAQKISKKEKKSILVYFTGSDWCTPCKMLKQDFFSSNEFSERSTDYVLVMIDYPRRIDILTEEQLEYNKKVIGKYNKEKSFPKLLMLNSQGKEKGKISGYGSLRDTGPYFDFLDKNS
ncbi:MAG: thioredoxin family protein [Flavobacteriaceae bacterium]|nr:thioredoxin family protein [Flavobacteriaceae bacterium]